MNFPSLNEQMDLIRTGTEEIIPEEELVKKIEKSISRQLISDVPIGAFLSGGIDSSTIVLLMKKLKSDVRTFTVGFDFLEYDESKFAEKIAKKIGTKHTTFNCSKNEVLKAAANLQKKIHPDLNRDVKTERLSQLVNEAKEKILKNDFN